MTDEERLEAMASAALERLEHRRAYKPTVTDIVGFIATAIVGTAMLAVIFHGENLREVSTSEMRERLDRIKNRVSSPATQERIEALRSALSADC